MKQQDPRRISSAARQDTAAVQETLRQLAGPLNHPTRLAILAGLRRADKVEFRSVKESLGVSDSVLSKQMSVLEEAELIAVTKGFVGKRARTWLSITPAGEAALGEHFRALQSILHSRFSNAADSAAS